MKYCALTHGECKFDEYADICNECGKETFVIHDTPYSSHRDGQYVSVPDINSLCLSLKDKFLRQEETIKYLREKIVKLKDEHYKDNALKAMQEKLDEMSKAYYRGFPITDDERNKIEAWKNDWFNRKRGGDHYMGTSGGGFTYTFHPTAIGVAAYVVAPDGEKFQFQELG